MITITFPDNADQTKPFPKIMRNKEWGTIVLFRDSGNGTVLHGGQTNYQVGQVVGVFTPDTYEDYNGPVTLQNK